MLVFAGGAYASCNGSGHESAEWLSRQGMVGISVEYATRSTGGAYPANFSDAARAVRLVRSRAAEWGIAAGRIGVMGFSAGGHLASLLSSRPELRRQADDDLADRFSARPDLVVLAYPVISFVDGYVPGALGGTVENFFGARAVGEDRRREVSSELHVDPSHPPVFIWTTRSDGLVPYRHSELFVDACKRQHVPVAYTLYPSGPHGLGLASGVGGDVGRWTSSLLRWITERWGPLEART
ncbi:MAG: alpha/beta hydrolase [Rhizobacter sp.]